MIVQFDPDHHVWPQSLNFELIWPSLNDQSDQEN